MHLSLHQSLNGYRLINFFAKIVNIIDKALMSGGDEKILAEAKIETSNLMSDMPLFKW